MSLMPTLKQWKRWSLPSKLTAIGTMMTIFTTFLYFVEKTYDSFGVFKDDQVKVGTIPDFAFKFYNFTDSLAYINPRSEFILWLPQGVSFSAPNIPGKIDLYYLSEQDTLISYIEVKSQDSVLIFGKILNEEYYYKFLKNSDCDISFLLRQTNGLLLETYTIPFTKKYIQSGFLPVNINN